MARSHEEVSAEMRSLKQRMIELVIELTDEKNHSHLDIAVEKLNHVLDDIPEAVRHQALAIVAQTRGY